MGAIPPSPSRRSLGVSSQERNCPNCGAVFKFEDVRCDYCNTPRMMTLKVTDVTTRKNGAHCMTIPITK